MNKKFFIKRGEKKVTINFEEDELLITLKIPTNYDHDLLMDEFTELSPNDSVNIKAPELIEERLIRKKQELDYREYIYETFSFLLFSVSFIVKASVIAINHIAEATRKGVLGFASYRIPPIDCPIDSDIAFISAISAYVFPLLMCGM